MRLLVWGCLSPLYCVLLYKLQPDWRCETAASVEMSPPNLRQLCLQLHVNAFKTSDTQLALLVSRNHIMHIAGPIHFSFYREHRRSREP